MKAIFARQGIPDVVVSDNGPQFNSRVFVSFSENYGFTHLTSSSLHPQGNGEAERAVQTVKKLLKEADDPYVALLNYRATPLQHGSSPAELLMGRKLGTRVPTLPTQHVPDGKDMSKFQETDARLRLRQKINYDRRHKVRPIPRLTDGQPVWVKTPGDAEAVVVGPSSTTSTRSYNVRTERGIQRRDRHHLRRRGQQSSSGYDGVPKRTSTTMPSHSKRQQWEIIVTSSLMFSQMSSPRWQMRDVLNEQRSTPVLGVASRYPKDLIFKTYVNTWTIIAKRQMS